MNITKTLDRALAYYQRNDLERAEEASKKILRKKPKQPEALHLLGMIGFQRRHYESAIKYMRRAIDAKPNFAEAFNNLGNIYQAINQTEEAISCYKKALEIEPHMAGTYMNLGIVLQDTGKLNEAISSYTKVLQLKPHHYGAYNNLGLALHRIGKIEDAKAAYRKAVSVKPLFAEALNNLGLVLKEEGYIEEAIEKYRQALEIKPDYRDAYGNMGGAYHSIGKLSQAIESYEKALNIDSEYVDAYNNLGCAMTDSGNLREADKYFRHALDIQSDYNTAYSNILLTMHYDDNKTPEAIFCEHIRFADQFEKPLIARQLPHLNEPLHGRKVRIGYVSPDFRKHSVAYFIEPIIASHNHDDFEIFCYADVAVPDEVTKRLQNHADAWHPITGQSEEEVAELIRKHRIDILVDLAGHTAKSRILVFARKPAPVQVSWIGYPATTGLKSMDYKIVDNYTDPPGMTEQFYTEKLLRLPESFLCYLPDSDTPDVNPLPAMTAGYTTFGSCNNFSKLSPYILSLWQGILKNVPTSHLIIKAKSLADSALQIRIRELFSLAGIADERLSLLSWTKTPKEHLNIYSHIDIALDTFPYNGTTTTCEALWMGVPVITLSGSTHASRVGESLMSNAGLPELIARTEQEYVDIATNLAKDIENMKSLRQSLRERIARSPLTDAKKFTSNLEKYYMDMWSQRSKN